MSSVNIKPQELNSVIQKFHTWSQEIDRLGKSMRACSENLNASWKDPQYVGFKDRIDLMYKRLMTDSQELAGTAKQLSQLKQQLEMIQQIHKRF